MVNASELFIKVGRSAKKSTAESVDCFDSINLDFLSLLLLPIQRKKEKKITRKKKKKKKKN